MGTPDPFEGGNPFEGMPIFGDLAKLFMSGGPINWEIAKQMALWLATEGKPADNADPVERIKLEELMRVADLHVREITGLEPSTGGTVAPVLAGSRTEWATHTLDDFKPLLEKLATSLGAQTPEVGADELMGGLGQVLAPVMLGFTAGSMVGHLAQRALGQYDVPIPRPTNRGLMLVPEAIRSFADDWSLPADDVRMWICVHELTHHAVLTLPHVRHRLDALLLEYAGGFRADPDAMESQMAGIDPSDPSSFQNILGNPESMLGAVQTPEQRTTLAHLSAITAAIAGYVDHVLDRLGGRLIGSYGPMTEALRRRRVEASESDRFVERLLGLDLNQAHYDRGERFAQGISERAGDDGLARLWTDERSLPTPAEVDAPGLWLARIDLPES